MKRRLRRLVNVTLDGLIRVLPYLAAWIVSRL
jgi:hypothetical protein